MNQFLSLPLSFSWKQMAWFTGAIQDLEKKVTESPKDMARELTKTGTSNGERVVNQCRGAAGQEE
jgi:hypothetical protein